MDIDAYLKKQSPSFVIILGMIANLLIGAVDYMTGYHFHVSAYYLIPVFLTVWYANVYAGIGMSTVSWLIMIFVYFSTARSHRHYLVHLWNITSLFVIYNIFAFVLSNLKLALAERRQALSMVRTLTGLVPRCASCDKILGESNSLSDNSDEAKLVAERREALSKVRTLTELIPSCASCRKINYDSSDFIS
ncbi:MAG: hypothetical protein ABSB95_04790 [Dissulfurispiraceae bacterium]|jgi:hypothetical protein